MNNATAYEQEQTNSLLEQLDGILSGDSGSTDYKDPSGANPPKLDSTGMTPVKWNGTTWVKCEQNDPEWYDYSQKKWANVMLGDAEFEEDGTVKKMGSMMVWIPRYAYSITSGVHGNGISTGEAGEIDVKFVSGTSNTVSGITIGNTPTYDTGDVNTATKMSNYVVHPAFISDTDKGGFGTELTGLWVGKFETSHSDAGTTAGSQGTSSSLQIVPNVTSWRSISVSDIYDTCINMKDDERFNLSSSDSHMMKNSEWGAVTYLAHSQYGRNGNEVTINNSSDYITGNAGDSVSAGESTGVTNAYHTEKGQLASTTGNIYGVYDMSGGAYECTAAYVDNGDSNLTTYGESLVNAPAKYKNVYSMGSNDTQVLNYTANSGKYGDAIYETSRNGNNFASNWFGNSSVFPSTSSPFFKNGGSYYDKADKSHGGLFYSGYLSGNNTPTNSFRITLIIL